MMTMSWNVALFLSLLDLEQWDGLCLEKQFWFATTLFIVVFVWHENEQF